MKRHLRMPLSLLAFVMGITASMAQIVTTSPSPLQENSANVVLTYHADAPEGNNGLKGVGQNTPIYAHIGVITNNSQSGSDWKHAPQWGDNSEKYKLDYVSPNTWNLTIGDIRTYFGVTDPSEIVKKIAIVFRTADCKKEGKTKDGGDIFVDVLQPGLQVALTANTTGTVFNQPTTVKFTVASTRVADLKLMVNGSAIATAAKSMRLEKEYTFASAGNYEVVAVAESDGETATQSATYTYLSTSPQGNYPGGKPVMGTVENADGSVTFCLAAPGKSCVTLVPSWADYKVLNDNVMKYHDYDGQRYFWITVKGLDKNSYLPYYFLVDGKKVGDPYAELVLDPYNDKYLSSTLWPDMPKYPYDQFDDVLLAVYCGRKHDFNFAPFEIPSHHNLIVYEMLFRDFTGTEGKRNGDGTIRQAMDKIPYLKALGVNAVELMPIMEFNGNNSWGYNTNFYMAPDKAYGSPLDYKRFINECHRNGIAVILDIVFNQSDGLHPWYQLYDISDNPFYNKKAPHDYSVLNDWKQDNPLVQQHWADALTYWLTEYNVDGFRFDLVKGLGNNDSYGSGTEAYNASRVANMKRLHAVMESVKPGSIHINENLAGAKEENEMAEDGQLNWSVVNNASCQYAMGWADGVGDLKGFYAPNWGRNWGSTVSYAESHDEERMGFKQVMWAPDAVKKSLTARMDRLGAVAAQMLVTPGPKMIWQFGELGAEETTKNSDYSSNDTSPKTVIWSYLDNEDRAALHNTYAEMCNLRTQNPDLFDQDAQFVTSNLNGLNTRTFKVTKGGKEVIVFANGKIDGGAVKVSVASSVLTPANCKLVTASKDYNSTLQDDGNGNVSVTLAPNQYVVYTTQTVSGIEGVDSDLATSATVYGGYGQIIVEGQYQTLSVYNLSGQSYGTMLEVPAGVYVVVVDGNATKVIVR